MHIQIYMCVLAVAIDSIICNNPLQGQVPNQENCSPYDYQNLTKLMAEVC